MLRPLKRCCHLNSTMRYVSIVELRITVSNTKSTECFTKTRLWPICVVRRAKRPIGLRDVSGFRCEVAKNCAVRCYDAVRSGNLLPTLRDNLSVPYSSDSLPLKMWPIGCTETSVRNCHYWLRHIPEERGSRPIYLSYFKQNQFC